MLEEFVEKISHMSPQDNVEAILLIEKHEEELIKYGFGKLATEIIYNPCQKNIHRKIYLLYDAVTDAQEAQNELSI